MLLLLARMLYHMTNIMTQKEAQIKSGFYRNSEFGNYLPTREQNAKEIVAERDHVTTNINYIIVESSKVGTNCSDRSQSNLAFRAKAFLSKSCLRDDGL